MNGTVTEQFHISVKPVGENQYLLRTERVASGVTFAQELVVWPIKDWLTEAKVLLNAPGIEESDIFDRNPVTDSIYVDYLCELSKKDHLPNLPSSPSQPLSPTESSLRALSQQIYQALFVSSLADSWNRAQAMAQQQGKMLLLRLILKENRLKYLPWEFLEVGECLWDADAHRQPITQIPALDSFSDQEWGMARDEEMDDQEEEDDSAFISGLLSKMSGPQTNLTDLTEDTDKQEKEDIKLDRNRIDIPPQPVPSSQTQQPADNFSVRLSSQLSSGKRYFMTLLSVGGLVLASASLLLVVNPWLPTPINSPSLLLNKVNPDPSTTETLSTLSVEMKKVDNSTLAAKAINYFSQGNLTDGQQIVEILLDRNALPQAKTALIAVPIEQRNLPANSFLFGRLAWQSVQVGNQDYTLDDVLGYWETAVKGEPTSPLYHNAMGFALYAKGDYSRANQAWFEGLYQAEEKTAKAKQANKQISNTAIANNPKVVASKDALNSYAGIALALARSAQNQPANERSRLLSQAIKLRQKVNLDNPTEFKPEALKHNWLWTNKTIQDWQTLQNIK